MTARIRESCELELPHPGHEHTQGTRWCPGVAGPDAGREPCEYTYPHLPHYTDFGRRNRCPGVRIPRDARALPPKVRRLTLAALRSVQHDVGLLVGTWNVRGRVYDGAGQPPRPRRIDEYPENDAATWTRLADWCDHLIAELDMLRTHARKCARLAEAHKCPPSGPVTRLDR